jgi:phage gp16-like protein
MRQEWYKSRNQYYQLLQVGKQELGWDNDFYYDVWLPEQGATAIDGRISAKSLSVEQLDAALKRMKQSGFKPKAKNQTRPLASDAQSRKIRALWLELHKAGIVNNPDESALANFVKRMYKIDALQWISSEQASKVIFGLEKWLKSKSKSS